MLENKILSQRPSPKRELRLARLYELRADCLKVEEMEKNLRSMQRQSVNPTNMLRCSHPTNLQNPMTMYSRIAGSAGPITPTVEYEITDRFCEDCTEFCEPDQENIDVVTVYSGEEYFPEPISAVMCQLLDDVTEHFIEQEVPIQCVSSVEASHLNTRPYSHTMQTHLAESKCICPPPKLSYRHSVPPSPLSVPLCLLAHSWNTCKASPNGCSVSGRYARYYMEHCVSLIRLHGNSYILDEKPMYWAHVYLLTITGCDTLPYKRRLLLIVLLKNSGFSPNIRIIIAMLFCCTLDKLSPLHARTDFGGEC